RWLSGALLVEPPPGQGPDLPVTEDRALLVTDTTLDTDGRVVAAGAMGKMMGRQGEANWRSSTASTNPPSLPRPAPGTVRTTV
ncbi:MAG: hypothetical protein H0W37_12415, partial [Pseudonocardiales bacterium]|nr:hypothetical protein [Pseudonocardiales bacterium]